MRPKAACKYLPKAFNFRCVGTVIIILQIMPFYLIYQRNQNILMKTIGTNACFLNSKCFEIVIKPLQFCKSNIFLAIFVFSRSSEFQRRQLIRKTWANKTVCKQLGVDVLFVLALADKEMIGNVKAEGRKYGDIAQLGFNDSFSTLTYRGLAGMFFISKLCTKAIFAMKTDDDMLINIFAIVQKLKNMKERGKTSNILMGYVWLVNKVFREGRYAVSRNEYKNDYYPPFLSGVGFIMSFDIMLQLLDIAKENQSSIPVHIDDIYITGILASRLNIRHIAINDKYLLYHNAFLFTKLMGETEKIKYVKEHIFWHLHDGHVNRNKPMISVHFTIWETIKKYHAATS